MTELLAAISSAVRRVLAWVATRNFDAAGGGRRWSNARTIDNANAAMLGSATTIRRRARYYTANNPWAANGINALVSNLVGTGIKPLSAHPDEKIRARINADWERWTDAADADGLTDFYGMQALAVRTMIEGGEAFCRFEVAGGALRVRLMDGDQVDPTVTRDLPGGARVVAGVEFDAANRRTAYHVYRRPPGDPLALATPLDLVRVPAADVAHLFVPTVPGQVRGISWLSGILLRLHELDQLEDASLVRQKVAALFAAFITDAEGGTAGITGTQTGAVLETGLEPGTMKVLPPGTDIKFSEPAAVGDAVEFIKLQLRGLAAGLGVTYEQLTGDLSGVNYSSIRAGLVEVRRRIESLQHSVVVFQFCRPTWRRFITLQVLTGALQAPDFERNPETWLSAKWIGATHDWVDPASDAKADAIAIAAGLKSRREVVAGRGYDVEQIDAEIAADQARAARLGLNFGVLPDNVQSPAEKTVDARNP